jgi:hypothetical protein
MEEEPIEAQINILLDQGVESKSEFVIEWRS